MRQPFVGAALAGLAMLISAAPASAQSAGDYHGYASGFLGTVQAGDLRRTSVVFGAGVAVNEETGWGAEMDFGFADDDSGTTAADTTTFMFNANWTRPQGLIRPYGTAGLGVLRVHGCVIACPRVTSASDLGANAGVGAYLKLNDFVAGRADVRYLWAPGNHADQSRPDNFGFWRATFGVTLMWHLTN